jgi:hypothetical protein
VIFHAISATAIALNRYGHIAFATTKTSPVACPFGSWAALAIKIIFFQWSNVKRCAWGKGVWLMLFFKLGFILLELVFGG